MPHADVADGDTRIASRAAWRQMLGTDAAQVTAFYAWAVPTLSADAEVARALHRVARFQRTDSPADAVNLLRALCAWRVPAAVLGFSGCDGKPEEWIESDAPTALMEWLAARGKEDDAAAAVGPRPRCADGTLGVVVDQAQIALFLQSDLFTELTALLANSDKTAADLTKLMNGAKLTQVGKFMMHGLETHKLRASGSKPRDDDKPGSQGRLWNDMIADLRVRLHTHVLAELADNVSRGGAHDVQDDQAKDALTVILALDETMWTTNLYLFSRQRVVVQGQQVPADMFVDHYFAALRGVVACMRLVWGRYVGDGCEEKLTSFASKYYDLDRCASYQGGAPAIMDDIPLHVVCKHMQWLKQTVRGNDRKEPLPWADVLTESTFFATYHLLSFNYQRRRAALELCAEKGNDMPTSAAELDTMIGDVASGSGGAASGSGTPLTSRAAKAREAKRKGKEDEKGPRGETSKKCHNCGKVGHMKRECRASGGGAAEQRSPRKRSRSKKRQRRSRSRSRSRTRSRSRSRTRQRSRSPQKAKSGGGGHDICRDCGKAHPLDFHNRCDPQIAFYAFLDAANKQIGKSAKSKACFFLSCSGRCNMEARYPKDARRAESECARRSSRDGVSHDKRDQMSAGELADVLKTKDVTSLITGSLAKTRIENLFTRDVWKKAGL